MIWCIKTYIIAYVKTQKNKIYVKPTAQLMFKIRFPKYMEHCFIQSSYLWLFPAQRSLGIDIITVEIPYCKPLGRK